MYAFSILPKSVNALVAGTFSDVLVQVVRFYKDDVSLCWWLWASCYVLLSLLAVNVYLAERITFPLDLFWYWWCLFNIALLSGVFCATLLYESPGGNQVDGLPPAQSTGASGASWAGAG